MDFQLDTSSGAQRFSSRAHGFLVLDGERIPWETMAPSLDASFGAAGPIAFIFYRPWSPGSGHKSGEFRRQFGESRPGFDDVLFVTAARTIPAGEIFALRNRLGSHNSGIWLFGACSDADALARSLKAANLYNDDAVFIAAECADHIEAALALDEGGRSTLFLRVLESTARHADQLRAALASIATQPAEPR
jgi:hypothetical protein